MAAEPLPQLAYIPPPPQDGEALAAYQQRIQEDKKKLESLSQAERDAVITVRAVAVSKQTAAATMQRMAEVVALLERIENSRTPDQQRRLLGVQLSSVLWAFETFPAELLFENAARCDEFVAVAKPAVIQLVTTLEKPLASRCHSCIVRPIDEFGHCKECTDAALTAIVGHEDDPAYNSPLCVFRWCNDDVRLRAQAEVKGTSTTQGWISLTHRLLRCGFIEPKPDALYDQETKQVGRAKAVPFWILDGAELAHWLTRFTKQRRAAGWRQDAAEPVPTPPGCLHLSARLRQWFLV